MADLVQILAVLCLLLAAVVCGYRFYLRLIVSRQFVIVEIALFVALLCFTGFTAVVVQQMNIFNNIRGPEDVVRFQKWFFAASICYLPTLWSVKVSVNLLHLRLTNKFPQFHVWTIRSLYFLCISLPFLYLSLLVACLPVERRWNGPVGLVKACPPITRSWDLWLCFALNVLSDIWLCILPYTALIQIQEKRLRIAVCGVYGLAFVAIIAAVVRGILLAMDDKAHLKTISILSSVELSVSIIVTSLPGISSAFTRKYVYGSSNRSTQERTRKTVTSKPQEWKGLDHEYNDFSVSADHIELRAGVFDRQASMKGYSTEDDTGSADRIEKGGPVAVMMV